MLSAPPADRGVDVTQKDVLRSADNGLEAAAAKSG